MPELRVEQREGETVLRIETDAAGLADVRQMLEDATLALELADAVLTEWGSSDLRREVVRTYWPGLHRTLEKLRKANES